MSYAHICDICHNQISKNNYISVLVEKPQDRSLLPFHDAKRYDICSSCYSIIKQNVIPSINILKRNEDIAWEFCHR